MSKSTIILAAALAAGMLLSGCGNSPVSVNSSNDNPVERVAAAQPDLIIAGMTYLSNVGGWLRYRVVIKNQGTANIASIHDVVLQNFLSEDLVIGNADDHFAGGSRLLVARGLNAGESFTFDYYMLDGHWTSPKKFLVPYIDYINIISESNEQNNTYFQLIPPDLVISTVTITGKTPTRIDYTITIKNDGFTAIPDIFNVVLQNFISGDAVYGNADDVAAGGSIIGVHRALAAKGIYTFNFKATSASIPNKKFLIPVIDFTNVILEVKEGNNTKRVVY